VGGSGAKKKKLTPPGSGDHQKREQPLGELREKSTGREAFRALQESNARDPDVLNGEIWKLRVQKNMEIAQGVTLGVGVHF